MPNVEVDQPMCTGAEPWIAIIMLGETGAQVLKVLAATPSADWSADLCRLILASSDPLVLERTPTAAARLLLGSSGGVGGLDHGPRDLEWLRGALRGISLVLLVADLDQPSLADGIGELARERGALVLSFAPVECGSPEPWADHLRSFSDTLFVVPAAPLVHAPLVASAASVPHVLARGLLGLADSLLINGIIGVDFADYRVIFGGQRLARMSSGRGEGQRRAQDAALRAMAAPSLCGMLMREAQSILLVVRMGLDATLNEINDVVTTVQRAARADTNIVFASIIEEGIGDGFEVLLYAMGQPRPGGEQP